MTDRRVEDELSRVLAAYLSSGLAVPTSGVALGFHLARTDLSVDDLLALRAAAAPSRENGKVPKEALESPLVVPMLAEYGQIVGEERRTRAEMAKRTAEVERAAAALRRAIAELQESLQSSDLLTRMCAVAADALECSSGQIFLASPASGYACAARSGDDDAARETLAESEIGGVLERLGTEPLVQVIAAESPLPGDADIADLCLFLPLRGIEEDLGLFVARCRGRSEPFGPEHGRLAAGLAPLLSIAVTQAYAAATEMESSAGDAESTRVAGSRRTDPVTRTPCILVIDDDPGVRRAFERALENFPCDVILSPGGKAGLAQLMTRRVDLVFLDLKMAGMDGVETVRQLRATGCRAPVRIATGFAEEFQEPIQALAAEDHDFDLLHKPLEGEEIRRAAGAALKGH